MSKTKDRLGIWFGNKRAGWVLFLFAFLLYANTLSHEYTQDDAIVIYDNMFTQKGIEGIPGILKYDTFYGFFKEEGKAKLVSGGRYRPLTLVMFALEIEWFGKNPFVGHLLNVILFALLVVLLYKLARLLGQRYLKDGTLDIFAFVVALLFAVHPVHTEVVANIKGRDEIMSLLMSLLTLYLLLQAWFQKKHYFPYLAGLAFMLGLLSKENAITFVAVIPLAFYLFTEADTKRQVYQLLGLLGVSLIFLFIRHSVLGLDFGGKSMELMNNPFLKLEGSKYVDFTLGEKAATILYTLGKYIQLLFFPHPLTHDYYPRQIAIMHFGDWRVWLSIFSYLLLMVFALIRFKKYPILSFGIWFYLITLSIVSNILFPIGTNMSERFLFMPSVGFALVAGWLLVKVREKAGWAFGIILIAVTVLMSVKTVTRNLVWKDDFTLFTTDVKTSSQSAKVLNAAGGALVSRVQVEENPQKKERMLLEASSYLRKALEIHPNYKTAHLILGNANYYLGKYEEAIRSFSEALRIDPDYPEAKKNIAISYREAGKYYGQEKNDLQLAIAYLKTAYELMPEDYETVRLLGIANALSGNYNEALTLFKKGVELAPGNAGAFVNLGNIYYNMGDADNGRVYHARALEIDPEIFDENAN